MTTEEVLRGGRAARFDRVAGQCRDRARWPQRHERAFPSGRRDELEHARGRGAAGYDDDDISQINGIGFAPNEVAQWNGAQFVPDTRPPAA